VARRYDQQWTIRRSQWMGPLAGPFDVWANGQRVHLCETQMPETFSFVVPRTVLVDGLNRVVFRNLSEQTVDEDRQGYYLLEEIAVQPQRRLSTALLLR
jgi:hypothetical protein